jgi:hypothetical protein
LQRSTREGRSGGGESWPREGGSVAGVEHGRWWCGGSSEETASSGGPTDARERGELAGAICVAGGGSTAAAASSGAKRQRWQKQRSKTAHGELDVFIGAATVTVTRRRASLRWRSWVCTRRSWTQPGGSPAPMPCGARRSLVGYYSSPQLL